MDYSIGAFSKVTGLGIHTLRYYEQEGLITPLRDENDRRRYLEKDIAWIDFIKRLKATGMPIKEIKKYAALRAEGDATLSERMEMLIQHRRSLEEEILQLQEHEAKLDEKIAFYQKEIKDARREALGGLDMKTRIAGYINTLGSFLGKRDVSSLTTDAIKSKYGIEQVDMMVLFGGSILCGGDVLAEAMRNKIAKHYIIVGGAGHTTETLREKVHMGYPAIETAGRSEAEIFQGYLESQYGLLADYLECASTNCGNNITYLLDLIREKGLPFHSVILAQDATMQCRMDAGLRRYAADTRIINFATYRANVVVKDSQLVYEEAINGMWDMDRYITLLMGEIPRLSDNTEGYGPNGKGYIAHVDIPAEVEKAFAGLKKGYGGMVRAANPLYASTK